MNYFTFVKNNWAKLGLANYKTGVSSTKMKEAFKKSKGAKADTSEKQLSNKFSTADNKHFKRGVKMVKEAIEQDTNKEQYKNMDDMWNKLINNKPDMPTKKEADNMRKSRDALLQENADKKRREAYMNDRDRQHKEYIDKERKKVAARKMKAFLPFDIEDYDLPKFKKALLLFMTTSDNLPPGATLKIKGKNKFLKATGEQIYEYMERTKIQESDIKPFYKELVKRPRKKIPNKEKTDLIKTPEIKLTIRSFKGKAGTGRLRDAMHDYYKHKGRTKINLSSYKLNELHELIIRDNIPLMDLKHFWNIRISNSKRT